MHAGIILTGGGAKLPKIVELAKKELKLPVKIGLPQNLESPEKDPSFSTACGLVLMAKEGGWGGTRVEDEERRHANPKQGVGGILKKVLKTFIP